MAAVFAVAFFIVAIILHVAGLGSGHWDETTFMLAGMLCLALAVLFPGWPRR
jgi:hypothetical protein